jgi:eukaryotic-like serine/threonine-protein kinase
VAFAGTQRFEIVRGLGEGGMGVVFEAFDREQGTTCALKLLPRATPRALVRFKREFRALQGLSHPNLITLGELLNKDEHWFFTMELIGGVDLLSWVRGEREQAPSVRTRTATLAEGGSQPRRQPSGSVGADFDEQRLRNAFAQLADGLRFLHDAGKVHRDVKPSNILVTPEGRLVILDFGLVSESGDLERGSAGTPGYMAPEQLIDGSSGPASDLYATGVVLFRALTGVMPSTDASLRSALLGGALPAPRPGALVPGVPQDLDELCAELLDANPAARPTARELLARLGSVEHAGSEPHAPFVGRKRELEQILDAYRASTRHPVALALDGQSGIGKTALLGELVTRLRARGEQPLVLTGRCYEHEGIPYKAIDGVMDALGDALAQAPADVLSRLPSQAPLLSLLFPALSRVPAFARTDEPVSGEAHQLRRRAERAGRALFEAIAAWRPLVVAIDDFQWSDADSVTFLAALMRDPDAPPFLLVISSRTTHELPFGQDVRRLPLAPLPHEDARELAAQLLPHARESADAIAAEAGGNPFFVGELACRSGERAAGPARLEDVLWDRINACDQASRRLLELVAIAAAPTPQRVIAEACGLDARDFRRAAQDLRSRRLVRTGGLRAEDAVETHHDRIREAVVARLAAGTRADGHLRLADAIERLKPDDLEALVTHFAGGGDRVRAAGYALRAGDQAARALAFERAVAFYRRALDWLPRDVAERDRVREKLADGLANAGLGGQAAAEYERAAEHSEPALALELRRRAAEHLLRSGRLDEGLFVLSNILEKVRVRMPRTPGQAFASLLLRRARVRLRGLSFSERPAEQLTAAELFRADTLWAAAARLGPIDTIRAADFQARHLLTCLQLGEPFRVARALMAEATFQSMGGPTRSGRFEEIMGRARPIVERIDNPYASTMLRFSQAFSAYQFGRYATAFDSLWRAAEQFRATCTGAYHDASVSDRFALDCLFHLGEMGELTRRHALLLDDAERRGDLYLVAELRTGLPNIVWLCRDQPDDAQRSNEIGIAPWSQRSFYLQHYYHALAAAHIALYQGDGGGALRIVEAIWPKLRSSLLLKVQAVRTEAVYLRARAAIAEGSAPALAIAEKMASKLAADALPSAHGLALAARAAIAARRDEQAQSLALLRAAERSLSTAGAHLTAAACRVHLGEAGAVEWMRRRAVTRPDRFAALLIPIG